MENKLDNLIEGLLIIKKIEPDALFNIEYGELAIGTVDLYSIADITKLEELGFYPDPMYNCYTYTT